MASTEPEVLCLPMKLDAFVLNPSLCALPPASTIAPLSLPDYGRLRLDSDAIDADVVDPIDLTQAGSATTNPRFSDGGKLRQARMGVYLHWSVPRVYRSGIASTQTDLNPNTKAYDDEQKRRTDRGFPKLPDSNADATAPQFRGVPNRWLVVRRLRLDKVEPQSAVTDGDMKEFKAWVIEGDLLRSDDEPVDLEVDASRYVQGDLDALEQVGKLIGKCTPIELWAEDDSAPRVSQVSIVNSANQLFADYVPHNPNVFSMLDNFQYHLNGQPMFATAAEASYQVVGWHSNKNVQDDPMNIVSEGISTPSHKTRLSSLEMYLGGDQTLDNVKTWLDDTTTARSVCHGSMYSVVYSSSKKPDTVPADDVMLTMSQVSPVTMGPTTMDALISFVDSHVDDLSDPDNAVLKHLSQLEGLLQKQEEDVDSQYEAQDMLSAHNFSTATENDAHWRFAGQTPGGRGIQPKDGDITMLANLNVLQGARDQCVRDMRKEQWTLFSTWWKVFSTPKSLVAALKLGDLVKSTSANISSYGSQISGLEAQISKILGDYPENTLQKGAAERFYTTNDPTILVPGISSPWPQDYLSKLLVRLDSQIVPNNVRPCHGWTSYSGFVEDPRVKFLLPTPGLQNAAAKLLHEFFELHPPDADAQPPDTFIPTAVDPKQGQVVKPLYHSGTMDNWSNTQAWFPLFVEWEIMYYHIPFGDWAFEKVELPNAPTRFRYGIKAGTTLNMTVDDARTIQGRILILPQPTYSLRTAIQQVLAKTSQKVLDETGISPQDLNNLPAAVEQLKYLSSPLAGFTDYLLTLQQGSHVKPSRRRPGLAPEAIPTAISTTNNIDQKVILQMGTQTGKTPFGNQVDPPITYSPFKPVMHGQFKFTKLNIVDKFGQTVSILDLALKPDRTSLYPALSEYYRPQLLTDGKTANTVLQEPSDHCEWIQVPPSINQPARLNAMFLTRDPPQVGAAPSPWRTTTEWESPIWGWIVVNFQEVAVQVFLPDGTFYREIRLGGVNGNTELPKWKPFGPPDTISETTQIDAFLSRLSAQTAAGHDLLRAFVNMITAANDSLPHPPDANAEYLSAIIGRPLALVNTGWSLELATEPLENQSIKLRKKQPEKALLDYSFDLRIGDPDRTYDGMVAYFRGVDLADSVPVTQGPAFGQELDWDHLYTFFASGSITVDVNEGPNIPLYPYHQASLGVDPNLLCQQRNRHLKVVSAIMDPYTAIHGYTGILPIQSLSAPAWAVQAAMKKMTAFFSMGPLLITTPSIFAVSDARVPQDQIAYANGINAGSGRVTQGKGVPIPTIKSADWLWLQPVLETDAKTGASSTEWIPLPIEQTDNAPKWEEGPYTVIEGYLQMTAKMDGGTAKSG